MEQQPLINPGSPQQPWLSSTRNRVILAATVFVVVATAVVVPVFLVLERRREEGASGDSGYVKGPFVVLSTYGPGDATCSHDPVQWAAIAQDFCDDSLNDGTSHIVKCINGSVRYLSCTDRRCAVNCSTQQTLRGNPNFDPGCNRDGEGLYKMWMCDVQQFPRSVGVTIASELYNDPDCSGSTFVAGAWSTPVGRCSPRSNTTGTLTSIVTSDTPVEGSNYIVTFSYAPEDTTCSQAPVSWKAIVTNRCVPDGTASKMYTNCDVDGNSVEEHYMDANCTTWYHSRNATDSTCDMSYRTSKCLAALPRSGLRQMTQSWDHSKGGECTGNYTDIEISSDIYDQCMRLSDDSAFKQIVLVQP